jgi:type I restriction enzyme S subunit
VVAPPDDFVSSADQVFTPLLDRSIATALQAKALATLRDTLLPRLISGQLRLPEVRHLMEDAA